MAKLLAYQPAALGLAILNNDRAMINTLIMHPHFDVNATTTAGFSPLYYAVKAGDLWLVERLIKEGARVDQFYNGLSLRDITQQQMALNKEYGYQDNTATKIDQVLAKHNISFDQKKLEAYAEQIKPLENHTTQNWVLGPMKKSGYKDLPQGYCYGVAHVGIQALLIEERNPTTGQLVELEELDKRIDRMQRFQAVSIDYAAEAKEKRILLLELAKIEFDAEFNLKGTQNIDPQKLEKKLRELSLDDGKHALNINQQKRLWLDWKVSSDLTPEEKIDLEIPNFLDTVEVYHQAYLHQDILEEKNRPRGQTAVPVISMLTPAKIAEKGGMYIADKFSGAYDNDELTALLNQIQQLSLINGYRSPIAMQMTANGHSITVGYDPVLQRWSIIDANVEKRMSYPSAEFTSKMLRAALLEHNPNVKVLMNTNIFCTGHQAHNLQTNILKPLHASKAWQNAHAITPEKLELKNKQGFNLERYAIVNGDRDTVRKIHDYKNNQKSFFSRIGSVLYEAMRFNKHRLEDIRHREKAKPFKKALKQYKDVPQNDPVFNADTIKKPKTKIMIPLPPMSPTTTTVHKELSKSVGSDPILGLQSALTDPKEIPTANGEIDPILKQPFDAEDPGRQSQFRNACLALESGPLMNLLFTYQSEININKLLWTWADIRDAHPNSSQETQANKQIKILATVEMLMRPFDLRKEGLRERVEFRNAFLDLPTELKEVVLERYQGIEQLQALKSSINKCIGLETKTENIDLIEKWLAKKAKNDPVFTDVEDTSKVNFGQSQRTPG